MKKKSLILIAACAVLVLTASIGSAFAYFSTYEKALGGYVLHLGGTIEWTEDFKDWTKHIQITSRADSEEDVYVRLIAYGGSLDLQYSGDSKWSPAADGYYYYSDILKPGESTSVIDVKISNIPKDVDTSGFNVIVYYEAARVKYRADGTPYADWNEVLDVTYVSGGDN